MGDLRDLETGRPWSPRKLQRDSGRLKRPERLGDPGDIQSPRKLQRDSERLKRPERHRRSRVQGHCIEIVF